MSDTPRTDAQERDEEWWRYYRKDGKYVPGDFARDLERENARLREALAGLIPAAEKMARFAGATEGWLQQSKLFDAARAALKGE